MVKLIVFDWDGVLALGTMEAYFACYHEALEKVGAAPKSRQAEREKIFENWGKRPVDILATFLGKDQNRRMGAMRAYESALRSETFLSKVTVAPGVPQLITRLGDRFKLAIITGIDADFFHDKVMREFKIPTDKISRVFSMHDVADPEKGKPNPYMLERIIEDADVQANETILVGDAESDMRMASNAGAIPVAVMSGRMTREDAERLGVERVIETVIDLENLPLLQEEEGPPAG